MKLERDLGRADEIEAENLEWRLKDSFWLASLFGLWLTLGFLAGYTLG